MLDSGLDEQSIVTQIYIIKVINHVFLFQYDTSEFAIIVLVGYKKVDDSYLYHRIDLFILINPIPSINFNIPIHPIHTYYQFIIMPTTPGFYYHVMRREQILSL